MLWYLSPHPLIFLVIAKHLAPHQRVCHDRKKKVLGHIKMHHFKTYLKKRIRGGGHTPGPPSLLGRFVLAI